MSRSAQEPERAPSAHPRPARNGLLVGLAGQPNVGKSTIFNLLTGLSQHVGNWPGKTVERKEGVIVWEDTPLRVVDLPGTYSLTASSTEERITRDFILHESPDVVIMISDASALERNLYLLAELLALPAPVVLGLNMMDVAEAEGIHVEPHVLTAALGLPVVPLVATRNEGVRALLAAAVRLAQEPETFQPSRPEITTPHRDVLAQVRTLLGGAVPAPYPPGWIALKLLEGDRELSDMTRAWLPAQAWTEVATLLAAHEDAVLDIAGGRYAWIGRMMRAAVTNPRLGRISATDRLDKIAVHPLWGPLLLFALLGGVFWLTFTVALPMQEWLNVAVVGRLQSGLGDWLDGAPAWLAGLLVDGVLGGAGLVLTFVPVLAVFFVAMAVLEDSGYLARVAYVMDRFMHLLGLHGKSILPLFLGFGCNVPAVLGARVIESQSGRLLTILLAPLVPCSARLAVLAFLTPVFFGPGALPVAWGLVILNLLILAAVGVLLSHTVFRGQQAAFIMELPLYHVPNLRTIGLFVWHNLWAFLHRAGTLIVLVSVAVWALSSFPGGQIEHSYLARVGRALEPIGAPMGMDWRLLAALLSGFAAKENAVASLGVLYGKAGTKLSGALAAHVSPATGLSFLTVTMLFVPCMATVAVMRQETRSWLWTLFGVAMLLAISVAAGIAVYQTATWLGVGRYA